MSVLELINNSNWSDAINTIKLTECNDLFLPIPNSKGKNLFHYACARGNIETIEKYLKLKSDKIYMSDDDGNTGFHLLAVNDWDEILLSKIEKYPFFLKLKNGNGDFIYNLIFEKYDLFNKVLELMKKFKYIKYLNDTRDHDNKSIVLDIIDKCNSDERYLVPLKKLHVFGVDFSIPKSAPPLIYSINSGNNIITKFLIKNLKLDVNIVTKKQVSPLILTISNKFEELSLMILDLDPDVNYAGFENKYVPLSMCFKYGLYFVAKKILSSSKVDIDKRDVFLNTPIYYLIKYIGYNKKILSEENLKNFMELLAIMLERADLQNLNIENETPFHLLVKYGLWEDQNMLSEKSVDVNTQNKNGLSPLAYVKEKDMPKMIKFVEKSIGNKTTIELKENSIILPTINESDGGFGLFNADGIHNIVYLMMMVQKYDSLTIPLQSKINEKVVWDKYITLDHASRDDEITELLHSLTELYLNTFYCLIPSIIIWKDKEVNYFIKDTTYLERAINQTERFVALRITIIVDANLLHANIVVYDKVLNKLMRFEPYGDWEFHDSYSLDQMIIKLFKKSLEKSKQKSLKYLRPRDYLDKTKFQSSSLGDHEKSLGDPAGYCLAWCFWFLELKLNNPDDNENTLVTSALNKIINTDRENKNPLLTHIRSYGKQLDKEKNLFFEKLGTDKNEMYKMSYDSIKIQIIKTYVDNFAQEILHL